MSVIWYKVWFDLWHNKLRTLLVILSIAVGVFAVGATFGMLEQMLPNMDIAHRASLPSHATIYLTQPVDRETVIALKKIPGIEDIEPLNTIEMRWKLRPEEEWRKGNILMRDDYENQIEDVVQLRQGIWPDGKSLSIERMHGPFYGVGIGDQVIVEVDGQGRWFPVTGKIRHPFVPPPSMYNVAWFFASEEVMERFGIPPGRFTEIKFRVSPYSPEYARTVASEVKERLARQGIVVRATMYQDPNKHWGRMYADGMALVLRVLAVLSMVLSVILVLNTLTALITQQTNQIGILKAIGGTSYSVTKVYLVTVLIYGLLALCVALPLGSVTSFCLAQWFLGMYNIDYEDFSYSPTIIVLQVFAAVVVPLLAALIPVLKGAAVTVREAIASYGLGGDFGSSWIDRAIERIGQRFLISYYANALANTFRRKGRLVLTQLVLVTAGAMFLMVMGLSSSIDATLDAEFDRRNHDVVFYFDRLQRVDRTTAMTKAVEGVEKADMWLVEPATILHEGLRARDTGLGSQIQGVSLEDPMYVPKIVEGRWLQPGDDRVIVMNKETAEDEHINLGDTVTLDLGEWGKGEWEVVGFYRVYLMFGGDFSVDAIYAPRQAVYKATKKTGKATTLMVRAHQHGVEEVNMVTARLKDLFEKEHIKIVQSETMPELRRTSDTSFSMVVYMLLVLAVIIALVGGIGLMGSLWISVIERTKEIGILRSIGAVSFIILSMFMLESVIQGVLSWIIAVPISLVITPFMANSLGQAMFKSRLEYQYNYEAALIWLLIVVLISILSSIIPARNAARINVRESLSYE